MVALYRVNRGNQRLGQSKLINRRVKLHRFHPGKVEVQVYDYVDSSVPMLAKMHEKRMKGFKTMGYEQAT